jgi:hypothetical protein
MDNSWEKFIFRPTPSDDRFAYEDYDPKLHRCVVIDEFDFKEFKVTDLKKLLAGETITVGRKGLKSLKFTIQLPVVLISNNPPPPVNCDQLYMGVRSRLKIVEADELL